MHLYLVDENDIRNLIKRYSVYDSSENGVDGIEYETVLTIPELSGHPLIARILNQFVDNETRRLNVERFLYLCAALSSKMAVEKKRKRNYVLHCLLVTTF